MNSPIYNYTMRGLGAARRLVRSGTPRRRLSSGGTTPWHVAIVGSGPSAFYAADFLLKGDPDVHVDIYERLPVPFGLVRYGVAPDHQEVKNVTLRFDEIASSQRCSLLANVKVADAAAQGDVSALVPLSALREHYHGVVLAYGADADRTLGLPGEDLTGVHSARHFVEWYNGHPSAVGHDFGLASCETAVLIGHGNVALDCARMLSATPEELKGQTDVAAHAAAVISESNIRQVVLLGRRGVAHAAFTIKELRELSKRAGARLGIVAPADAFNAEVMAYAAKERPRKRLTELMQKFATPPLDDPPPPPRPAKACEVRVQFQRSPVAFLADDADPSRLAGVRVSCNALDGPPSATQRAVAVEGSEYILPSTLALRSVGYRSSPMAGAPFDETRGIGVTPAAHPPVCPPFATIPTIVQTLEAAEKGTRQCQSPSRGSVPRQPSPCAAWLPGCEPSSLPSRVRSPK